MLDVAVSYRRYAFLGNEFLTWLWFCIDNQMDSLREASEGLTSLHIGNRMVLQNDRNEGLERITLRGDPMGLEEGLLAMRKGALVAEISLVYEAGTDEWHFTLKGESLNISGLRTPEAGGIEHVDDWEGALLEKVFLVEKATSLVHTLYGKFIRLRLTDSWEKRIVPQIRGWVASS